MLLTPNQKLFLLTNLGLQLPENKTFNLEVVPEGLLFSPAFGAGSQNCDCALLITRERAEILMGSLCRNDNWRTFSPIWRPSGCLSDTNLFRETRAAIALIQGAATYIDARFLRTHRLQIENIRRQFLQD
ncbi:MAG: hypothetical protein HQM15_00275 [Deltaproteobacteria bacterium]|nr:hypothetical protein [Deltaproteobacteria bacterium]